MKTSTLGIDWIKINEENYKTQEEIRKFHLIKMEFENPDKDKIETVLKKFPLTNRFIVSDNIKFYNDILRARKKYYVENTHGCGLISFFKKNNKVLLNIEKLNSLQLQIIENEYSDILKNVEVISMANESFGKWEDSLKFWSGNVLLQG